MNKIISLLFFIAFMNSIDGQSFSSDAQASFENNEYDFGVIRQEDGAVNYSFKVKNTGINALIIYDVKASCGCTVAGWTKIPIPVGEYGEIIVTYNPNGSIGKFHKTLSVKSNSKVSPTILNIRGEVATDIPKIQRLYHFYLTDSIGMLKPFINFGKVLKNDNHNFQWEIANFSNETYLIKTPEGNKITLSTDSIILNPKQKTLNLFFNFEQIDKLGIVRDTISFTIQNEYYIIDTLRVPFVINFLDTIKLKE